MDPLQQKEAFRDGRIDLGILYGAPTDIEPWLRAERVYAEPLVAAVPESHPLAARPRASLRDFAGEPFLLFPRHVGPSMYDDIVARCRAAGFSPRVVQEVAGWHTLAALVSAGVGVAFLPRSLGQLPRPGVAYRPLRDLAVEMEISAAWKQGDRSPVRERFVTALRAVARARAR